MYPAVYSAIHLVLNAYMLRCVRYNAWIEAAKLEDDVRLNRFSELISKLSDVHREAVHYLVAHLARVVEYAAANKMEVRNLAIVFGPTLVRAGSDDSSGVLSMIADMPHQCKIVEILLQHHLRIFGAVGAETLPARGSAPNNHLGFTGTEIPVTGTSCFCYLSCFDLWPQIISFRVVSLTCQTRVMCRQRRRIGEGTYGRSWYPPWPEHSPLQFSPRPVQGHFSCLD